MIYSQILSPAGPQLPAWVIDTGKPNSCIKQNATLLMLGKKSDHIKISNVEKWELIHCWWEYKKLQLLWKTVCQLFKKLHRELPYEPAHKKEWSNDSWHNRDEPWKHTKWKNIKGHILHDSIYMKYPEQSTESRLVVARGWRSRNGIIR